MKNQLTNTNPSNNVKPLDLQVGGSHYKNFKIQPTEFCEKNRLTHCQSSVIKYVCRHEFKNGLQDLQKARHFIDIMMEMYYNNENLDNNTE